MKIKNIGKRVVRKAIIINQFGIALLVKSNGRHELVGGTNNDFTAAKEWISLFAHEVVLTRPTLQPKFGFGTRLC